MTLVTLVHCSPSTSTKHRPAKILSQYLQHPALPRPIDKAIAQAHGSSVALDATADRLETAKHQPTPSLKEIIEIRTRENSRLRAELAYFQQERQLGEHLREELEYVTERMQLAINSYRKGQKDLDRERETNCISVNRPRGEATDQL